MRGVDYLERTYELFMVTFFVCASATSIALTYKVITWLLS